MESTMHKLLDISCKKHQIYEFDLQRMTYNSTEIKIKNNKQIEYKILCQIDDDQILCYSYDKTFRKGRLLTINKNGEIYHRSWFDLSKISHIQVPYPLYYYQKLTGIKYQNYVYIISDHSFMLRYNLLKNSWGIALLINNSLCQSWGILKDKILMASSTENDIIYDCSINSISYVNKTWMTESRYIGTINKCFFIIDCAGNVIQSEELNPHKWEWLGKINIKPIFSKNPVSLNYGNLAYISSKRNLYNFLYKFDIENFQFTKFYFISGKNEAVFIQKLLSFRYNKNPKIDEREKWIQALNPIDKHFKNFGNNYIGLILRMSSQYTWWLNMRAFDYPVFEERKIIIIQNSFAFDIRRHLNIDPNLFNFKKQYFKKFEDWDNFCSFSLKNWSSQGVIIPNVYTMKWAGVEIKDIVEVFKGGKKGLIWILIGDSSSIYAEFIDQSEDKLITCYNPFENPFRSANEYLKEAGEKEIDWRIY